MVIVAQADALASFVLFAVAGADGPSPIASVGKHRCGFLRPNAGAHAALASHEAAASRYSSLQGLCRFLACRVGQR